MPRTPRLRLSGRASLAALACLALAVSGGVLLFSKKAAAQGNAIRPIFFSPQHLTPPDPNSQGIIAVLIGLLLPAVQRNDAPFHVAVMMGDGSVAQLVPPPDADRGFSFFDVFLTIRERGGFIVHLRNRKTQEEDTAETTSQDMVVRLLPAVQRNGQPIYPISGGETFLGVHTVQLGDGSVRIPFQYGELLPAVQK